MRNVKRLLFLGLLTPVILGLQCLDPGTDPTEPPAEGKARLTIRLNAPSDPAAGQRVVGLINAGAIARGEVGAAALSCQYDGAGETECFYDFDEGTQVTLVAVENEGFVAPGPVPPLNTVPVEFVEWRGDVSASEETGQPGVIAFTLDADRAVEAFFRSMTRIDVRLNGAANITSQADTQMLTLPPRSLPGGTSNSYTGDGSEAALYAYLNSASEWRVTVLDDADLDTGCEEGQSCWIFQNWTDDCAGSGKTCIFDVGTDSGATAVLEDTAP